MSRYDVPDPTILCLSCGAQRNCLLHQRAEFPPDAARRWLRRRCTSKGKFCDFSYRAGFTPPSVQSDD